MAFTRKKKIGVFLLVVLIVGSVVTASLVTKGNNITEVQISPIKKRDLLESKVTASGEVRPVKFYNLTAEVAGRVTNIYVKEGDIVKAGQELIKVDPTFQANNAASQESILRSEEQNARAAEIEWRAAENNVNSTKNSILAAKADLRRAQADLTLAEAEYNRSVDMVEAGVFSKAQFDSAKARREVALAAIESQQAHIQQLEDNLKNTESSVKRSEVTYQSTRERIGSTRAQLLNAQDQLSKTIRKSPINGVVSSLPLKEGEYVLSNFSSSSLVTIADMADVNVEVKVDETDISNVKLGQIAKVKVDALGETEIEGEVTEIGHSAVTRSGQTITQSSTSQEAKDFKVVVKLKATGETLNRLRPGMSATATITTDTRNNVLAIPMQALVIKDLEEEKKAQEKATPSDVQKVEKEPAKKREEQGVYIVKDSKAEFVVVKTGITGDTDIEVLEGLKESDQIITGPFRQLRNLKSGTAVKQETVNKTNKEKDEK